MSFSKNLVKDQTKISKFWHQPLIASAWVREGSSIGSDAQIKEPNETGLAPTGIPLLSFELLPWSEIRRLLTLYFFHRSCAMVDLFFFDEFIKSMQAAAFTNKYAQRCLVKVASVSHDAGNSQSTGANS